MLLETRLPPIDKYSCPECKRCFAEKPSLEAHQRQNLHAHCYNCDIVSPTRLQHAVHMQSHSPAPAMTSPSATQFRCCDCERDFKDEVALANHLRYSQVHKPRKGGNKNKKQKQEVESSQQTKCKKCEKSFKSQGALKQHMKSVRHNPLSNIRCLADAKCKKRFNCPSGQLHHLESGRCVSGMTKAKLNAALAANDTDQIITTGGITAQWLFEGNSSATSTSQIQSPILTPTSTEFSDSYPPSAIHAPTSILSTSTNVHSMLTLRPRTGSGSQPCPLCPPSRTRRFKPDALQQHLLSSVHAQVSAPSPLVVPDEISFHCPRGLMGEGSKKKAVGQFSTVSGLAQHLESGACGGGKGTLKRVVEYVQEEMKGMGFGALKLLK